MNSMGLNQKLIRCFPGLEDKYAEEVSWQEGDSTGSHTVFGDVLTPYLVSCIDRDNRDEIKRIFDFFEEILSLEDKYSQEVVAFSVLESILYQFKQHGYLSQMMGERLKKLYIEIAPNL